MKILYGVTGEGMGHATRSKVAIEHLMKKHDIRIVASGKAYGYLKTFFGDVVYNIEGFSLKYKNGKVKKMRSLASILKTMPKMLRINLQRYLQILFKFSPDLVISDFETFTYLFGKHRRIPIISIDNIHMMTRCRLNIEASWKDKYNLKLIRNILKLKLPACSKYVITSFFNAPITKKNTIIVPPIIREEIIKSSGSFEDHILVYLRTTPEKEILKVLREIDQIHFLVYGQFESKNIGNVNFRPFSSEIFIKDFANSAGVITNGGFSLISEAIYLGKPVCSIPFKGQPEQFINAYYLKKIGYGEFIDIFSKQGITKFLEDLPRYKQNLQNYNQDGNKIFFATLDSIVNEITK